MTCTANHWSNEEKALEHLTEIVVPYIRQTREDLGLSDDQKALLIFDVFKGQKTPKYLEALTESNCVHVFVPNNMTSYFQPLDLTINGPAKAFLKKKFETWYSEEITRARQGKRYLLH